MTFSGQIFLKICFSNVSFHYMIICHIFPRVIVLWETQILSSVFVGLVWMGIGVGKMRLHGEVG